MTSDQSNSTRNDNYAIEECIECGEGESFLIPVWEDISDYYKEGNPDYIGCTNCHTMHPLGTYPDTENDTN